MNDLIKQPSRKEAAVHTFVKLQPDIAAHMVIRGSIIRIINTSIRWLERGW